MRELAERTAGRLGAELAVDVDDAELGDGAQSSLFQVIREALDQAVRRGPPRRLEIVVRRTPKGGVELVVSDDGAPERRQAVLDGLAERAAELNGTFEASRADDRTTIRVVLPRRLRVSSDRTTPTRSRPDRGPTRRQLNPCARSRTPHPSEQPRRERARAQHLRGQTRLRLDERVVGAREHLDRDVAARLARDRLGRRIDSRVGMCLSSSP